MDSILNELLLCVSIFNHIQKKILPFLEKEELPYDLTAEGIDIYKKIILFLCYIIYVENQKASLSLHEQACIHIKVSDYCYEIYNSIKDQDSFYMKTTVLFFQFNYLYYQTLSYLNEAEYQLHINTLEGVTVPSEDSFLDEIHHINLQLSSSTKLNGAIQEKICISRCCLDKATDSFNQLTMLNEMEELGDRLKYQYEVQVEQYNKISLSICGVTKNYVLLVI